jgi:hypothetical protein
MMRCCEHSDEPSGFINKGDHLDYLSTLSAAEEELSRTESVSQFVITNIKNIFLNLIKNYQQIEALSK